MMMEKRLKIKPCSKIIDPVYIKKESGGKIKLIQEIEKRLK
jgi:hypothetical protein